MDAVNISVVLDRSGSMTSIGEEVVNGFNLFLARQRQESGEATITLVQFDDQDPFEVLIDAVPVREVTDLDRAADLPRGTTPLYDAVAQMIGRIDARESARRTRRLDEEDQLVAIITDGLENASREHTRRSVFDIISERRRRGWAFLLLGADQDAYAAGDRMGLAGTSVAGWDKSAAGTDKLWRDVSRSTEMYRRKSRKQRLAESDDIYRSDPEPGEEE